MLLSYIYILEMSSGGKLIFWSRFDFISANASEPDKRDLMKELETMKQLKPHPHVIKLLGCVMESGEPTMIQPRVVSYSGS